MEHLNLKTKPNTEFNLEALYQICPACFTEVRDETTGELRRVVDFDKLKSFLGGGMSPKKSMNPMNLPG